MASLTPSPTRPALPAHSHVPTRRPVAARSTAPHITLVASDVDGTMLDSQQRLSARVIAAVAASEAAGVPVRDGEWREGE